MLGRLLRHPAAAALARRLPGPVRSSLGRLVPSQPEEAYEPELRAALLALAQPGSVCADVGAHHGVLTRVLAERAGTAGHVVAFEAHPDNARVVRERLAAFIPVPLRVENVAVTDGSQPRVALHPGRDHASFEWNIGGTDVDGRPTPPELEVAAVSLDDYFAAEGLHVDLVKIDVEGAEAEVLRGMRRLLHEDRPALAIEFHDERGWAGRELLVEAGYELYAPDGTRADAGGARLYHCLALPPERPLPAALAR